MKKVLRGKSIVLIAIIKKLGRSNVSNLMNLIARLKILEQKETRALKRRRWKKIIIIGAEINKLKEKEREREWIQGIREREREWIQGMRETGHSLRRYTR